MHSICQLLETSYFSTFTYYPQTNEQLVRYNRTLSAMMRSYVNENQPDWHAFVSTLTYDYNSQTHRSTNTHPFDLVPSLKISVFTLNSTVSTGKMLTVAE